MKIQDRFTPLHRILHWIMAIAMPVLFITGFLRIFWINEDRMAAALTAKTQLISQEDITIFTEGILAPIWQWHIVFAHVMIFAFLVRILYMISRGIRFPNPFADRTSVKERLQGMTYIYFYAFVLVSVVSGIIIKKDFLPENIEQVKSIHKLSLFWFPIFIVLHLAGIIWAEFSDQNGITSKMIAGIRKKNKDQTAEPV